MKRFRFKLEKVLKVREFEKKVAESRLSEANGRCILIEQELAENAALTSRASRDRFAGHRPLSEIRAFELYSRRLEQERERIMARLAAAEEIREAARAAYVEASTRFEAIQKLSEREEAEHYRLARLEEVKSLDDMAQNARAHAERELLAGTA